MDLLLWLLLFVYFCNSPALGELVKGFLGETVELRAPIDPVWSTLTRSLNDGSRLVVARRDNGVWIGEGSYRTRVVNSSSGVSLKDLNYNDNGLYEFSGPDDKLIQLDVFPFFNNNVSVSEGETGKLPCYFVTLGNDVSLQWDKHNQTVLKVSGETVEYGAGYEGSASVSGWRSGDLSLILENIHQEDQGDYFCSVVKGTKSTRTAVRLTALHHPITPSNLNGTDVTTAPLRKETNPCCVMIAIVAVAACLILLASVAWILQNKPTSSPKDETTFPLKN